MSKRGTTVFELGAWTNGAWTTATTTSWTATSRKNRLLVERLRARVQRQRPILACKRTVFRCSRLRAYTFNYQGRTVYAIVQSCFSLSWSLCVRAWHSIDLDGLLSDANVSESLVRCSMQQQPLLNHLAQSPVQVTTLEPPGLWASLACCCYCC
jgi:hypothetical protein